MKPFSQKTLTKEQRIFNYHLSRAQRIIKNIFGVMANRFQIFHSSCETIFHLLLDQIDLVVLICYTLHNFLERPVLHIVYKKWKQKNEGFIQQFVNLHPNYRITKFIYFSIFFKEYSTGEGQLTWQESRI